MRTYPDQLGEVKPGEPGGGGVVVTVVVVVDVVELSSVGSSSWGDRRGSRCCPPCLNDLQVVDRRGLAAYGQAERVVLRLGQWVCPEPERTFDAPGLALHSGGESRDAWRRRPRASLGVVDRHRPLDSASLGGDGGESGLSLCLQHLPVRGQRRRLEPPLSRESGEPFACQTSSGHFSVKITPSTGSSSPYQHPGPAISSPPGRSGPRAAGQKPWLPQHPHELTEDRASRWWLRSPLGLNLSGSATPQAIDRASHPQGSRPPGRGRNVRSTGRRGTTRRG